MKGASRLRGRVPGVADQDPGLEARVNELAAGKIDHGLRQVDADRTVSVLGQQQRQRSGSAAQIQHVDRWIRYPRAQSLGPSRLDARIA